MEINTSRLLLRNFKQEDFKDLKEIISQKEITKYVPIVIANDDEELQENLDEYIESYLNHYYIAIVEKESNKLIGMIICIPLVNNDYDVSYLISKKYTKRNYCYEALKSFINYFKEINKDASFVFSIDEENIASQKVMEKLKIKRTNKKCNTHDIFKIKISRE